MTTHRLTDAEVWDDFALINSSILERYEAWLNENRERIYLLARDNRKELRKIFGKPNGEYVNSKGRYDVWFRDFKGERFMILSAPYEGTTWRIHGDEDYMVKSEAVIIEFMDSTFRQLRAHVPSKWIHSIKDLL